MQTNRYRDAPAPAATDVRDDSLAYIDGKRHAVMELAFSANHQLPRTPAYVLEPDSDHFLRAKAKTRHEQQHRVVAPPDDIIGSNGFEQSPDLVRRQMARQGRLNGNQRHQEH